MRSSDRTSAQARTVALMRAELEANHMHASEVFAMIKTV